jgi:integrase/recombinase XerC
VVDPLKPVEVDQFIADLSRYRDLAIVLTMLVCGLRSQEVILLRMEDVNFHQSSLRVRGKGKRERLVPMPFALMQVYEKYLEIERSVVNSDAFFVVLQGKNKGQKLNRHTFRAFFWYHRKKLGLPKARPHQFRHAFASDLARVGVPLTTIQRLLGHADPKTSMIYIELFLDDIREEYNRAMKRIAERYAALSN